jgi:hypothetical protein
MSTNDLSREGLLQIVRDVWEERDPVPEGLVERMLAVVQAEAILSDVDLDYELLVLVERSTELAGARGTAAYTLQFAHGDTELLIRAASSGEGTAARLDGWLAPAERMTVRAVLIEQGAPTREWETDVDDRGRFEFKELPSGLFRLWLTPRNAGARPFATPAFEI